MTSIHVYDPGRAALPELPPIPIGALMVGAAELLQRAADLPQPRYAYVDEGVQEISLYFNRDRSGIKAVTRWALRFGAVVAREPVQSENGPVTCCYAEFSYYGVTVIAKAFIPAGTAST